MIFDYIIVGAGSAGCVLANRLSADPSTKVLLIEAGGRDDSPLIHMPAGFASLLKGANPFNWAYETQAQPHLDNRRLYWPRGKGWGGSSSINAMVYIRGPARDYDGWNCPGWAWDDVQPFFRRAESVLRIGKGRSSNPLFRAFVRAGVEAGYPEAKDLGGQEGFGRYSFTIHKGRRWSAARAYLTPVLSRPNLTIASQAHAQKVTFRDARVTGVDYLQDGVRQHAEAAREVILSAGAVNTPQLLMLSGIGDAAMLQPLGIPMIAEIKEVGRNLQDHLDLSIQHESLKPVTLFRQANRLRKLMTGLRYKFFKSGVAAQSGLEAGGFVKSRADLDRPDLQFHFVPALVTDHTRKKATRHGFTARVCHLRPQSRGHIALASPDPLAAPLIQPNYLEAQEDRRALREGVRIARGIFAQNAFTPYRGAEIMPGAGVRSEAEIDAWIRGTAETIYHPVGTARMGADGGSVTDLQLKVRGVSGLRVADASIIPRQISGNTNATVMMIAEKIADLILNPFG